MRARTDPALKARALELARQVGAAEASRRTGLKASTIRAWASREAPAPAERGEGLEVFEARMLERAKRAVEAALKRLEELLPAAKGVQSVAISAGILADKVRMLEEQIAAAQERQVRIAEAQADLMVAVLRLYLDALGFPFSEATRKLLADLLRQAGCGEVLAASPALVERAKAELLGVVHARVRREVEAEMRREAEERQRALPALPAPRTDDERLRAWQEQVREPEPGATEVETVTGELVDEEPRSYTRRPPGVGWLEVAPGRWSRPNAQLPPRRGQYLAGDG